MWFRFWICWLCAGVASLPMLALMIQSTDLPSTWLPWVGTSGAIALMAFAGGSLWGMWLSLVTAMIPGVGWLAAGVIYLINYGSRIVHQPVGDELQSLPLPPPLQLEQLEYRVVNELDFMPLVDIMTGTDNDLKRGAISKLAQLKTPEAIQILLADRSDSIMEIRFYVNAALSRIKKEFDEELNAARQQMKFDIYKVSARVFLAKKYLEYVKSGLLDPDTAHSFEAEAIYNLTYAVESGFVLENAHILLIQCYLNRHELTKALACLEAAQGVIDQSHLLRMQIEIYYQMGRYTQVLQLLVQLKSLGKMSSEWTAVASWWGGSV